MKVDLKGAVFVITGTLSKITRAEAEAAIKKVGGKTASSVTLKTTYVIVGTRPSSKYTKAKNMGIPILTEEDFKALISGKTVEVEEVGAAGERSVDELLGEVRSVMQGAPTAQMWSALVKLVDACRAEDVHVLTGYIDGYITRWTEESMKGLVGSSFDAKADRNDPRSRYYYYYRAGVSGELRVAPEHWVGEMQQGVDSPKYRLVRALDLCTTKMTSTAIVKVMAHPALIHLERLVLPERSAPSKGLVKAICDHDGLISLTLGRIDDKTGPAFVQQGTTPGGLKELDLSKLDVSYSMNNDEKICEFLHASYFNSVETLSVRGSSYHDMRIFEQAELHNLLPGLRHLHIIPTGYNVLELLCKVLIMPWTQARINHLSSQSITMDSTRVVYWMELLDIDYGAGRLEQLDLGDLVVWDKTNKKKSTSKTLKLLVETLPNARLLEHVDRLVLGDLKTDALTKTLSSKFPELEVV